MRSWPAFLCFVSLALGACRKKPANQTDSEYAQSYYKERCALCHGEGGKGDGPGSTGLNPKPRAFTDPSWQTSVTNEQIERIIVMGGTAVGKSPSMPAHPDLAEDQQLVLELRKLVRGFGGDPNHTK
jgi:hypothetical protein